jgi:undecaprenyl-diphosphatase
MRSLLADKLGLGGRVKSPLALVLLLAVFVAVGGFLQLASEIRENETRSFDEAVILAMCEPGNPDETMGSPRIEEIARDLTASGGVTVLNLVTLVSFGAAVFSGRTKLGLVALAAVTAGSVATSLLKSGYARPRPDLVEHGVWVYKASFPSGHSMMSAGVYLTLAILVARIQQRRVVRWFIVGVAVILTALVGASHVYLGVHWPTDVFAGGFLGAAWAVLFWLLAMRIAPRPPSR